MKPKLSFSAFGRNWSISSEGTEMMTSKPSGSPVSASPRRDITGTPLEDRAMT